MDILPSDRFLAGTSNIQLLRWVAPKDENSFSPERECLPHVYYGTFQQSK